MKKTAKILLVVALVVGLVAGTISFSTGNKKFLADGTVITNIIDPPGI